MLCDVALVVIAGIATNIELLFRQSSDTTEASSLFEAVSITVRCTLIGELEIDVPKLKISLDLSKSMVLPFVIALSTIATSLNVAASLPFAVPLARITTAVVTTLSTIGTILVTTIARVTRRTWKYIICASDTRFALSEP